MSIRETQIEVTQEEHSSKVRRTIIKDLENYTQLSDEIKYRANDIYNTMNSKTFRADKRKMLLFYCVYNAYKELNIKEDSTKIGSIFGLTTSQIQKSVSMFNPLQTGYKPVEHIRSITDYLPDYCEQLKFNDCYIDEIMVFADDLLKECAWLTHEVPQTAAAGVIKYYLILNDLELDDKNLLSEVTNRSDTTIETMYKKICNFIDREPFNPSGATN